MIRQATAVNWYDSALQFTDLQWGRTARLPSGGREHIKAEDLKPSDLLFQGERGELLAGSVIRRAWRSARVKVLTPDEFASPLGKWVYDLRHTRLTKWLNDGIPPAQVAEWAGNSVPILLAIYARCVSGRLSELKKRMEAGEDLPELPDAG